MGLCYACFSARRAVTGALSFACCLACELSMGAPPSSELALRSVTLPTHRTDAEQSFISPVSRSHSNGRCLDVGQSAPLENGRPARRATPDAAGATLGLGRMRPAAAGLSRPCLGALRRPPVATTSWRPAVTSPAVAGGNSRSPQTARPPPPLPFPRARPS